MPGEQPAPVVDRPKRFCVGPIQRAPAVAPHGDEADVPEHLQVFRRRWLVELDRVGDITDRPFFVRDELENVPPARLGNRVEGIRSGRGARHEKVYTFLYRNVSSTAD